MSNQLHFQSEVFTILDSILEHWMTCFFISWWCPFCSFMWRMFEYLSWSVCRRGTDLDFFVLEQSSLCRSLKSFSNSYCLEYSVPAKCDTILFVYNLFVSVKLVFLDQFMSFLGSICSVLTNPGTTLTFLSTPFSNCHLHVLNTTFFGKMYLFQLLRT